MHRQYKYILQCHLFLLFIIINYKDIQSLKKNFKDIQMMRCE